MSDFAMSSRLASRDTAFAPANPRGVARPNVSPLIVAAVLLPLLMAASALLPPHPDLSAAEIYAQGD